MAETFGPQKVRLEQALELIGDHEPVSYGEIVELIATASACKKRAAKDNLRILREARLLESAPAPDPNGDKRLRYYRVSDRGRQVLAHPYAPNLLRRARQLFTSCPSGRAKVVQRLADREGGRAGAWRQLEKRWLVPLEEVVTWATILDEVVDWNSLPSILGGLWAAARYGAFKHS